MAPKYSGPWVFSKKMGNSTYELLDTNGNVEKAVAVVQLKKVEFGKDPALDDNKTQPPRDASFCKTARKLDDSPVAQTVLPKQKQTYLESQSVNADAHVKRPW